MLKEEKKIEKQKKNEKNIYEKSQITSRILDFAITNFIIKPTSCLSFIVNPLSTQHSMSSI